MLLISPLICLLLFLVVTFPPSYADESSQSFYELLGVSQDADLLTIRKAFKRLAIQKHPDKNPDDPNAHSNFVRINRAYEVLKDEELRRKYDQFGEKGLEEGGAGGGEQYQSWQFYRDNFGIYDEDPEVITLSRADFQEEVFQSGEIWFVNFYSAYCSHCHLLAPVWRELAKQMPEGVARIGAVNCAEDPHLCQSQRVTGYPSLMLYPMMEFFQGPRELSALLQFILSRHPAQILRPAVGTKFPPIDGKSLLFELCSSEDCLSEEERKKIAAIAGQLGMAFAVLNCADGKNAREWCEQRVGHHDGLFFMAKEREKGQKELKELFFADLADLRLQLLAKLAPLVELDAADMDWLLQRPPGEEDAPTLALLFPDQSQMDWAEWRRLQLLFPHLAVRAVPCHRVTQQCAQMHPGQMPRPALFRPKLGGFDMDYGNTPEMDVRRVAKFVRRSADSNLVVLSPDKYWEARNLVDGDDKEIWLIDFFAPWCPPCLRLLNELRKLPAKIAVGEDEKTLRIGTMNCEAHPTICQEEGVNSYPRTVLFVGENEGEHQNPHKLVGFHSADDLLEFIDDALSPSVIELDDANFDILVNGRAEGQLYFVDFFAPWCGPCQQLAPEFRRLARQWAKANPKAPLSFGSVDCEQHGALCRAEGIRSYPSLRLYRHDAGQLMAPADYPQNWWRNAQTMAHWLGEMMPSKVQKLAGDFATTVLDSTQPFLVDFYAPWCSHCVQFAPTFERLAQLLDGQVQLGKVDCERFGWICQSAGVHAFPSIFLYFGADQRGRRQSPHGMAVPHSQDADKIAQRVRQLLAHHQERRRDQRDEL